MSGPSSVVDKDSLESIVLQSNVNYYASLVAFAILYYDYLLTFGEEVRFFWRRRANSVTILFFLNRYLSILGNIPVVLQSFRGWSEKGCVVDNIWSRQELSLSDISCNDLQKFHQFFSIIVQVIVGAIVILRTYALYERSLKIAITMALFAFLVVCIGVWAILGKVPTVIEPFDLSFMLGCHPLISKQGGIHLSVAWGGLLLFDSVIFTLTLFKAIAIWKLGTRRLFHVLIRDGTIYYLVLAMANLSNILTFLLGEPILRGVSTTFANAVSVTMISRLMINLQNPNLFQTRWQSRSKMYTTGTDTHIGPFVTTIVDRDGATTMNGSRFVGTGLSTSVSGSGMGTDTSGSGVYPDELVEEEGDDELFARPANALWYDRAWVSGSASANGDDVRREIRTGTHDRTLEAPEEIELSPTLGNGPTR